MERNAASAASQRPRSVEQPLPGPDDDGVDEKMQLSARGYTKKLAMGGMVYESIELVPGKLVSLLRLQFSTERFGSSTFRG